MPACRRACSISLSGRREEIGDALWQHPGVDGVVFTGSREVGLRIHAGISRRWIKPVPAGAGRQERGDRDDQQRGSRCRGRRRDAVGLQPAEPEVQRDVAGLRATGRSPRPFVERLLERTRAISMGDPTERDVYFGPVINATRGRRATSGPRRQAREEGTIAAGRGPAPRRRVRPRALRRADRRPAAARPARCSARSCSCRFLAIGEVGSLDQALAETNAAEYGLTAGIFSATPPRSSASSTRSRPASAMPTSAPAPPRAPGPARSRSAGWKARARAARAGVGRTTWPSSSGAEPDGHHMR